MPRLTEFIKVKIIVLWEQNKSLKSIARELNIDRNTVRLWVRRFQETGELKYKRQGPLPITYTNESSRHRDIVNRHTRDPFTTTRSSAFIHDISLDTVRRHLHAAGIHNYRPAKKISLTEAHRQSRIRFATQYKTFDWENEIVIFTDEKTFKSDKDGRKILWRRPGERYNSQNVLPLRTSGRLTLGYWGWMSSAGPGELVEMGARMNSERYLDILKDVMIPTVRNVYPDGHIYFIQDNSAVHQSRSVIKWFSEQTDITLVDWPSKSPDLNVIENLWGQMVLNWDSSEIKSKQNLNAEVMRTWELMRLTNICCNMVKGMKSRLEEVIDSDGHPIHY